MLVVEKRDELKDIRFGFPPFENEVVDGFFSVFGAGGTERFPESLFADVHFPTAPSGPSSRFEDDLPLFRLAPFATFFAPAFDDLLLKFSEARPCLDCACIPSEVAYFLPEYCDAAPLNGILTGDSFFDVGFPLEAPSEGGSAFFVVDFPFYPSMTDEKV